MATPGGPLLSVADMLRDLSEESSSGNVAFETSSSSSTQSFGVPAASQKLKLEPEARGLPQAFEETYKQLHVALRQSGHKWTGLTQELCATLTTADKLVITAHSNLEQLSEEVNGLQDIVERGQNAILKLQTNINENTSSRPGGR